MLKLPALSFRENSGSDAGSTKGSDKGGGYYVPQLFQRSGWQTQGKRNLEEAAAASTGGSTHEKKYRSAAIQCEVKLTEALAR
eukprot:9167144-Pyramimonas_sp.AAC.1